MSTGFLSSTFRSVFRIWAGDTRRRVRQPNVLLGEPLEPRQCLSAAGIPGGVYEPGNLNQADIAMLADVARARYDVDGSGIKVGIISVSFNNLEGEWYDIQKGALPEAGVPILHDYDILNSGEDDEGRAMAQLVHAIAPGAELIFAAGWDSSLPPTPENLVGTWQLQFAQRIGELVDAGCDIIVDDLGLATEPWFQDGPISQAVDAAVQRGTAYFVAAANDSNFSYESTYRPVEPPAELAGHPAFAGRSLEFHDFDPGDAVDVFQRITLPEGYDLDDNTFAIQWDQPWGQNNSTVEVWFFDQDKNPIGKAIGAEAYPVGLRNVGETPVPGGGTLPPLGSEFFVAVVHVLDGSDSPGYFKWMAQLNGPGTLNGTGQYGSVEFAPFGASTAVGHYNSELGVSVGAAPYWETPAYGAPTPQFTRFSSWGGTPIFFDASGTRLDSPLYREQPRFVAPQEGDTTFFVSDSDEDQLPNFQGTSAAAPNAAAVAALMLQLDGSLTPDDISRILERTAVPMPSPLYTPPGASESFNFATGAGA